MTNLFETKQRKVIEEITPFFVDERKKREMEKDAQRVKDRIIRAIDLYKRVTGDNVQTIEEVQSIVEDPARHYLNVRIERFSRNPNHIIHQLQEYGLDVNSLIKLPDDFFSVVQACRLVECHEWKSYTVSNGSIEFSNAFNDRLINKACFVAVSDLQKKRLKFANKVCALLKEQEELLRLECKEAGIHESKVNQVIENGSYLGPLPYAIKSNDDPTTTESVSFAIRPNEDWVCFGHRIYASDINLGGLIPSKTPRPAPQIKYKRFWKTEGDGGRRAFLVPVGRENDAYLGAYRDADIKFEEGEYLIIDGKMTRVTV